MSLLHAFGLALFGVSAAGAVTIFILYPLVLLLRAASAARRWEEPVPPGEWPTITMIVVARNAENLIGPKIRNALDLTYPPDRLEVIVCSDGSSDATAQIMYDYSGPRVRCLVSEAHVGKNEMLNRAALRATGEVLVFSDADARLSPDALWWLVRHFADPEVGGVCGHRLVRGSERRLGSGQEAYLGFDYVIKSLERRTGSISSNDGKLYAVRRRLFREIAPGVTDDLYTCLWVLRQGARFTFDPRAVAHVAAPARSPGHEISRRRRIVSRSLRAIWLHRELLAPWRHPSAAFRISVNKVCRRLLPLWMIGTFAGSAMLSAWRIEFAVLLVLQAAFYGVGSLYPLLGRIGGTRSAESIAAVPMYFMAGNAGTFLGLLDFLRGRSTLKWDPRKTDQRPSAQPGAGGMNP